MGCFRGLFEGIPTLSVVNSIPSLRGIVPNEGSCKTGAVPWLSDINHEAVEIIPLEMKETYARCQIIQMMIYLSSTPSRERDRCSRQPSSVGHVRAYSGDTYK